MQRKDWADEETRREQRLADLHNIRKANAEAKAAEYVAGKAEDDVELARGLHAVRREFHRQAGESCRENGENQ